MTKVDIKLLKELRSITNAPLKDCKAALVEAN
jgi:translation elongation factor EF-Ts